MTRNGWIIFVVACIFEIIVLVGLGYEIAKSTYTEPHYGLSIEAAPFLIFGSEEAGSIEKWDPIIIIPDSADYEYTHNP